jgi:hypothetical protein
MGLAPTVPYLTRVHGCYSMAEQPQLVVSTWVKGEPVTYRCSACGQTFLVPEDCSPREAMAELVAAFRDHVHQVHADEMQE